MDTLIMTGVILDPRSEEEKAQDYTLAELALGIADPVVWKEKLPAQWRSYSIRNQAGSSSCVAQSVAKMMEVNSGVVTSAHPIYRRRSNYSEQGMWLQQALAIMKNNGTTTEALDVSQNIGETDMNRDITVETPLKAPAYVKVGFDIDSIARAIESYKSVCVTIYGQIKNWSNIPTYDPTLPIDFGHGICAVDYFLFGGKKYILIDDSWGTWTLNHIALGNGGQRLLSEDFIKNCVRDAGTIIPAPTITPGKPVHIFSKVLIFGMINDPEVKVLQDCLTYFGYFPADTQYHSGNYLQMTARAVKKWQVANNLLDFQYETDVRKVVFGNKSIVKMNSLLA